MLQLFARHNSLTVHDLFAHTMMMHSHTWHDAFIYTTWFIWHLKYVLSAKYYDIWCMWALTCDIYEMIYMRSYMWYTWNLTYVTSANVYATYYICNAVYVCHDLYVLYCSCAWMTWLVHMYDMTHSHVCIHMPEMTTWFIQMYDMIYVCGIADLFVYNIFIYGIPPSYV